MSFLNKHSIKVGLSFGLTSGIITTLGLMVGLHSGTHSQFVVIGGILTIAVADSFSDAMGIHIAEESEKIHTSKEVWEATISTLIAKFVISSSFIIPFLLFSFSTAIIISVIWGLLMLGIFSYFISKGQETKTWKVIVEHLTIAIAVIVMTHYLGLWISNVFTS